MVGIQATENLAVINVRTGRNAGPPSPSIRDLRARSRDLPSGGMFRAIVIGAGTSSLVWAGLIYVALHVSLP